jgi:hemoglobin
MKRALSFVLLIGIAMATAPTAFADASLFERMGGTPVVAKVVDQLLDLSMTDPRTKRSFQKINLKRLREKLNEQICTLSNGPCQYTGDSMKEVHAGLDITDAEFDGLVEHLIMALDAYGVGLREKNELLKLLAPMKRDVVTR